VGDVELGGGSLPAVRVDLLPFALSRYGVSSEDVRTALQASNANRPKGTIEGGGRQLQIYTGTQAGEQGRPTAKDYRGLVVAWRGGAAIRLSDVAAVSDSVENINTLGLFNGDPAVIVLVPAARRQRHRDRRRRAPLLPDCRQLPPTSAGGGDRPHPFDPRLPAQVESR
jgi:multidrug efflux pump